MNTKEVFNLSMCTEKDYINLIDREYETQNCINSILTGEKTIIIGERGVGKTSLIYKVRDKLIKDHSNILPIYVKFSPMFFNNRYLNVYLYHLLHTVVQFIWKDIIGKDFSDIYDNDIILKSDFEKKILKVYNLIRISERNELLSLHKELGTSFGLSGNLSKEKQEENKYLALTNQEIVCLFKEVCEHLVTYLGIDTIAFLCDEANNLKEEQQIELEESLINIFGTMSCSFVYVASIFGTKRNSHFDLFENSIILEGFDDIKYTKELIFSRIKDNDLFSIDNESIAIIHNISKGNPLFIIRIISLVIGEENRQEVNYIDITPSKAALAGNKFIVEQLRGQEILNNLDGK